MITDGLRLFVMPFGLFSILLACSAAAPTTAGTANEVKDGGPITVGQRIFYTGHSFHVFIPPILDSIAESAGISGQKNLGLSSIGGSQVIQHWNVPDDKNEAKKALATGQVDVLTMAPIFLPDAGIENFATLALAKNPKYPDHRAGRLAVAGHV